MSIMFTMIKTIKSLCIFEPRISDTERCRIYHVTLSIIVLAMYSRRRMDGRRTTSFPDLTATPKGKGQQSSCRLHASPLDLLHDPARGGDGGEEDEDDEPPDDISVAAGTELLDYDSDQNSDFCHENTSSRAATGTAPPAAADDTITFKVPEPMKVDVANNPTQASTGLMDPLYYQCRSARLAGFWIILLVFLLMTHLVKKFWPHSTTSLLPLDYLPPPTRLPPSSHSTTSLLPLDYLPPQRADVIFRAPPSKTTFHSGVQGSTHSRHSRAGFVYFPVPFSVVYFSITTNLGLNNKVIAIPLLLPYQVVTFLLFSFENESLNYV
jgi:hypothetical protein